MKRFASSALFLFGITTSVFAQEFKATDVAIFKNSSAFIRKKALLDPKQDISLEKNISPNGQVILGTLWFKSKDNKIKSLLSYPKEIKNELTVNSNIELLKENIGKKINLVLEKKTFESAEIIEVIGSSNLIIKHDNQWITVDQSDIKRINFLEKPDFKKENKTVDNFVHFDFEKDSKANVEMICMQKGVSWIPNYLISLDENDKATVRLRASVQNNLEDFINVNMKFVVGIPSFSFQNRESLLTSLKKQINIGRFYMDETEITNNNYQSLNLSNRRRDYAPVREENFKQIGEKNEDLFFYSAKNVTLKEGARGFFEIEKQTVDVEHIYEVNLNGNSIKKYFTTKTDNRNDVWHSIKFKNTSTIPFTTGTAFVTTTKKGLEQPVSQNKLEYTPSGAFCFLKMTISPDVSVLDSEQEIARKENATRGYDMVTVEGKIELKNYSGKKIDLEIKRMILGKLQKTDLNWEVSKEVKMYDSKNQYNNTSWKTKLEAGGTKTITYTYQYYVKVKK